MIQTCLRRSHLLQSAPQEERLLTTVMIGAGRRDVCRFAIHINESSHTHSKCTHTDNFSWLSLRAKLLPEDTGAFTGQVDQMTSGPP